jgi:DNA-binding NarL/FixJ family response regulator
MSSPTTVLVADDHPVVRAGICSIVEKQPDLRLVGEVGDGRSAVEAALRLRPRVVVMDLQMPGVDGIAATKEIKAVSVGVDVVLLTTFDTELDVARAVEAGVLAYLLKDSPPDIVVAAIRAAARGESTLAPSVAARMMGQMRRAPATLTRRELDVLAHVARGATNAEIARALRLSEATVKTHLLHVFDKLGVSDRTAAVTVALEQKLLRL